MKAKKYLGQNFLKSEQALRKIVEAGEIKPGDIILEIGPGRGALTSKLLASRCQVLAVEKDSGLYEMLKSKFKKEIGAKKLILINADILQFDLASYQLESYKLVANIPYNITGAILKKFLTAENQPGLMVLMVQHEVAKRIMAQDEKESLLSLSVKVYGEPKMIMKVPKRYFAPAPKVDSAVISIKNISRRLFTNSPLEEYPLGGGGKSTPSPSDGATPQEGNVNEEKFWEIVKAGFAHKRKKLGGNLKNLVNPIELAAVADKRAEDLALVDWIKLAKLVS